MPILDVFQQVFILSLRSNEVNFKKGSQTSLQRALQKRLVNPLPHSDWTLAWGPVVYKEEPDNVLTGPDNSWYIAFHPHLRFQDENTAYPTYVVAVSGTPEDSKKAEELNYGVDTVTDIGAWVNGGIENVPEVVRRESIEQGKAYIATGTVTGVHLLLTTAAPNNAEPPSTTLLEFITNVDRSASPRFIFTGHSLGGALSPSLALALVMAGKISARDTFTYPTAGYSPGNVAFSTLFSNTLQAHKYPSASYKGWNLNLANTLDVVPHAWSISSLKKVPTLYGPPIAEVVKKVDAAISLSRSSGVLYKALPTQTFGGERPDIAPSTEEEFKRVSYGQHIQRYITEVGGTLGAASLMVTVPYFHLIFGFERGVEVPVELEENER